jgi:small subunit ribosomal protein S6e
LVIVSKGEGEVPGLTDTVKPRRLGPKRASKLKKLFNLEKSDDVRQYVVRRQIEVDGKKPYFKAPKIQRLITPQRLQHKRQLKAIKRAHYEKSRKDAEIYNELVAKRTKEQREARARNVHKRRSESRKLSEKA